VPSAPEHYPVAGDTGQYHRCGDDLA